MFFSPCEPCCATIGFETSFITSVVTCGDPDYVYVESLSNNIGGLTGLKAVWMGASNNCISIGSAIRFAEADWPAIAEWIDNGGRLWVGGEHYPSCMPNEARLRINEFMVAIGSSMTLGQHALDTNCEKVGGGGEPWNGIVQNVPIMNGIDHIHHALTTSVSGGTPLALMEQSPNLPFISMQAIGAGFVILAGDSNITAGCPNFDNCDLFNAFINNENEEML